MKRAVLRRQGAAIVEFALVLVILVALLFGLVEFGRALHTWNTAVDATRRGARTAAIVGIGDSTSVVNSMRETMRELPGDAAETGAVLIEYSPNGITFAPAGACVRGTCQFVRVSLALTFHPAFYLLPRALRLPTFATTLPVEALGDT